MAADIAIGVTFGGSVIEGDISISNITGNVEVSAIEGDIELAGISGSVSASSVNGNVVAVITRLTGDEPLYFTSVDGDIDVTLPANTAASLAMKCVDGDIFTDFDITINSSSLRDPNRRAWVSTGNTVAGEINGGGREIRLNTVDGDIYLRKGK